MKYRDPQLRRLLAGEYVLGTLLGRARRRFERLQRDDVALRDLVQSWEQRLAPLIDAIPPRTPPSRIWRDVERRIAPVTRTPFWQRVGVWRPLALLASVLVVVLVTQQSIEPPSARYVAVLANEQKQTTWLVRTLSDDRIEVAVLSAPPTQANRAYELWVLPGGNQAPRSLGLLPITGRTLVDIPQALRTAVIAGNTLAVSIEPAGGSPTGLPTGPVVYLGVLQTAG